MSSPTGARPRAVLIGPMGAGKTTVGRILAQRWGVTLRDTDLDIEAAAGKTVQDIFVEEGEAAFRERERDAVAVALAEHEGVLSLGGGAVLDPSTQERLVGHDVVMLRVGLSDAVKRVGLESGRPLLLGNVRGRIKQLLDERAPIYEATATVIVDTDGLGPGEVADAIEKELPRDDH
ncbi:shikimate kinase [Nocardioides insulae]|uniref:shikimate kinase n=1 Tax=Nocardioides insulae TaxID=394734 RepID=UPI00055FB9D9